MTGQEPLHSPLLPDQAIDFVLVTALAEERDALLSKLPGYQQLPPAKDDIRTYFQAYVPITFPDNSIGTYRVIVMCLLGMGRLQAVVATADAIRRWHPRYILLIGIAGGMADRNIGIGDILISDQIVDYELQNITSKGPKVRWEVQRVDPRLLGACNNFRDEGWQELIQINRPGPGQPNRYTGPIASGDKIIAFGKILARYQDMWPKLIGVEMEAAGVATAAFQSAERPGFFMVRGVSDLADEAKGSTDVEKWHLYACDVAASFTIALLKSGPVPLAEVPILVQTKRVELILEGVFSEFTSNNQQDIVGKLAELLSIEPITIRVLKVYRGSIVIVIEMPDSAANRLYGMATKHDFRIMRLGIVSVLVEGREIIKFADKTTGISGNRHEKSQRYVMAETRPLKVFLCHAATDKPKVRTLYRRLVEAGFDPWLDEEKLLPGQDWDLEIRKAVRAVDVVIVCLTRNSINKEGYVQKEIRVALDVADEKPEGTIYLIPARFEECPVPERLSRWQWVNIYEENGYRKLYRSLELRAESLGIRATRVPQRISKEKMVESRLPIEPQLVHVPAGPFLMGSADNDKEAFFNIEKPQHNVELSEYWIGKYPLTNLEYRAFVNEANHRPPPHWNGDQYPEGKGDHPVVNVSWNDALAYYKWLAEKTGKIYRLPTEAEWEKAASWVSEPGSEGAGEQGGGLARGVKRRYPWGDEFDRNKCNTHEAGIGNTTPVGKYSPAGDSPYGCADMAGNVWEWCADWFDEGEYGKRAKTTVKDPPGPGNGIHRVLRGGCFDLDRGNARCAFRLKSHPDDRINDHGFRVVVSRAPVQTGKE